MNKLLHFLTFLISSLSILSQTYDVDIWLPEKEGQNISVKIQIPVILANTANYTIPGYYYGQLSRIATADIIQNFRATDSLGHQQPILISETKVFRLRKAYNVDFLEYEINPRMMIDQAISQEISPISYLANTYFFGELSFIIGYINQGVDNPFHINIHHPESWNSLIEIDQLQLLKPGLTTILAADYESVSRMPILFGSQDKIKKDQNSIITQLGNPDTSSQYQLQASITKLNSDLIKIVQPDSTKPVRQIFLWHPIKNEKLKNKLSGISFQNHSLIFLYSEQLHPNQLKKLEKITAHEWFHNFTPTLLRSESKHTAEVDDYYWLYEGLAEYFSEKFMVSRGYNTLEEFEHNMSNKIRYYVANKEAILMPKKSDPSKRNSLTNFYNQGAIVCWLLDLQIHEQSGGHKNLWNVLWTYLEEINYQPFNADHFFKDLSRLSDLKLTAFADAYIYNNKPLDFDAYLSPYNWDYTPSARITKGSFGYFQIVANSEIKGIYFDHVADNVFKLMDKDILISIDGNETNADNFDLHLLWLQNPMPGKKMHLEVSRGGRILTLYGIAVERQEFRTHAILPGINTDLIKDVKKEKFLYEGFNK